VSSGVVSTLARFDRIEARRGSAGRVGVGGDQAHAGGRGALDPGDCEAHRPRPQHGAPGAAPLGAAALRAPAPPLEARSLPRRDPPDARRRRRNPWQADGEILEELGYDGGKTILDDYLREVRPHFLEARTYQRTCYRPGELVQFDLWEPSREIPVGYGQTRPGFVVVGCAPWSRAGSGAVVFSKQAPDLCFGMARCLTTLGALPERLVWDCEGALHAGNGRPTDAYAGFCGQLPVGWIFCRPRDAEAKGAVERLQQYMESSFEPGRRFAGEADFQAQLDGWFRERANARLHRVIRAVPAERLALERERMRPLPDPMPDTDRRFTVRVPPQPYVRVDTNDYQGAVHFQPAHVGASSTGLDTAWDDGESIERLFPSPASTILTSEATPTTEWHTARACLSPALSRLNDSDSRARSTPRTPDPISPQQPLRRAYVMTRDMAKL
jgi:transposase